MGKKKRKRSEKIGLPPGSLVAIGEEDSGDPQVTLIDYSETKIVQKSDLSIEECLRFVEKPTVTWLNIRGTQDEEFISKLGAAVGLHPLMLEDIVYTDQRTKLDDYKETLFIVLRLLQSVEIDGERELVDEQVSMVLGANFVISFTQNGQNIFAPIVQRLHVPNSRTRKYGADFLCYSLVDCIVDHYFIVLESVDEELDQLEDELIHDASPKTLQRIQQKKRDITSLRKIIWPLREVISRFQRLDTPLVRETTRLYLHDVYDHSIQAMETIESFRDISAGLLDMYMSTMSQKMNEIMKMLTLVATLFVPLTFIASIYGMNFKHMPELESKWGYYIVLSFMGLIAMTMLLYFKRRRWI